MTDLIAIAKAKPALLQQILGDVLAVSTTDPSLIPDAITAYETKGWGPFALKHLALFLTLASRIQNEPEVIAALTHALA